MARRSRCEDPEELHYQDTDSDVTDQRENRVKVKWTPAEDERLKTLVKQFGQNEWKLIASLFPNRSDQQCQHRWLRVLHPDLVKGPWTKEEDQRVIELVKKYGTKHWTLIAKHLKGRVGKQCRERWHNHLNPEVKKSSWTEEEDRIIYAAHKVLGNRWAEIAKLLPGRTDNAVKNHWNSTIKRKVETGGYLNETKDAKPLCLLFEMEGKDDHNYQAVEEPQKSIFTTWPNSALELNMATLEDDIGDSQELPPEELTIKAEPESEEDSPETPGVATSEGTSPEKWVVEYVNFLGPSSTPAFTEALDLIESDPDGWCDLSNFDLPDDPAGDNSNSSSSSNSIHSPICRSPIKPSLPPMPNVTEYRLDGHIISDLIKSSKGELIPISPCTDITLGTPPSVLKRHKRKIALSPVTENSSNCSFSHIEASNSMTPKGTPVKALPFSPSQFLNFWTKQDTVELENPSLTSTPVCSQKVIVTTPLHRDKTPLLQKNSAFITPNHSYMMDSTPHTPTPFKNALEKYGPMKPLPPTPHLEEDLKEMLRSEAGIELIIVDEAKPEKQRRKQAHHRSPMKKVRKSLALDVADREVKQAVCSIIPPSCSRTSQSDSFLSRSLNDSSLSIKEENSLLDRGFLHAKSETTTYSPRTLKLGTPALMSSAWKAVACGGTKDQLIMQQKARAILNTFKHSHTSRTLILS